MCSRLIGLAVFGGLISACGFYPRSFEYVPDLSGKNVIFKSETKGLLVTDSLIDGIGGGIFGVSAQPGLHDYALTVERNGPDLGCRFSMHQFKCEGDFSSVEGQQYKISPFLKEDRVYTRVEDNDGTWLSEFPCLYTGDREVNHCSPSGTGVFLPTGNDKHDPFRRAAENPGLLDVPYFRTDVKKSNDNLEQKVNELIEQGERNRSKPLPTGSKGKGNTVFDHLQGLP